MERLVQGIFIGFCTGVVDDTSLDEKISVLNIYVDHYSHHSVVLLQLFCFRILIRMFYFCVMQETMQKVPSRMPLW